VVPRGHSNRHGWFAELKARAISADLWHYMDPGLPMFHLQVDLNRLAVELPAAQGVTPEQQNTENYREQHLEVQPLFLHLQRISPTHPGCKLSGFY
jgi:hypothetical protein